MEDVSEGRGLPSSARVLRHADLATLVEDVRAATKRRIYDVEPGEFHRLRRPRRLLQRALASSLAEHADRVRVVAVDVARFAGLRGALAVQDEPYARAVPPGDAAACQPFHVDAYVGHPVSQLGLWMPLVDVAGPEGLWLVDDDVMAAAMARGPLSDQQRELRAAARPIPVVAGEILLLGAHTGHGGVPHDLPRTRVSFDLRVCPAADAPRGRLGWRSDAVAAE